MKNKSLNDSIYFCGCPCHIIYNVIQEGNETFACKTKFDNKDMIDQHYWINKSAKPKTVCCLSVNLVTNIYNQNPHQH